MVGVMRVLTADVVCVQKDTPEQLVPLAALRWTRTPPPPHKLAVATVHANPVESARVLRPPRRATGMAPRLAHSALVATVERTATYHAL